MSNLKPDTDQAQDKSYQERIVNLCTLTGTDNTPRTREQHAAAASLLTTETLERERVAGRGA